ncbi:unnamed protein product, partial [Chrysoparadoxa australica]
AERINCGVSPIPAVAAIQMLGGGKDQMLESYRDLVTKFPGHPAPTLMLAHQLLASGAPAEEARALFLEAAKLAPPGYLPAVRGVAISLAWGAKTEHALARPRAMLLQAVRLGQTPAQVASAMRTAAMLLYVRRATEFT